MNYKLLKDSVYMQINYNKILELYGIELFDDIKNNSDIVINNINYLSSIGIIDISDVFERYPYIFLLDNDIFIKNVDELSKSLDNYIEELNNDTSLWERLL